MLLLGIDVGTSSIKVSLVDSQTQQCAGSAQFPDVESEIKSVQPGWAEQSPDMWWQHVQEAIKRAGSLKGINLADVGAIGIAYQMHGLVVADKKQTPLRDSIIWCDSRAVP
ncbi:MAG TPA: FGGY family carbohydrate kinase, partial [Segetibacter sp.]